MLPIDPTDSSDPGGPITWPPQRPPSKLGGHRVDLRLRPIPLSPDEVRRESSTGRMPSPTRVFLVFSRHTSSSGVSSTARIVVVHRDRPVVHSDHSACGLQRHPPPQRNRKSGRRRPPLAQVHRLPPTRTGGSGNGRRALVGMSYKGPSAGERPGQARGPLHRPVLVTLPIDPADSSDPGGPVTWPPRRLSQQAGRPPYGSSSPADPALPGGSA